MADYVRLGILDPAKLNATHSLAVRIASEFKKGSMAEVQAKLIAYEVSKMFSSEKPTG